MKKDSVLYVSVGQAGHLATSASNRIGGWNGGGGTHGNPSQTNAYYNIAGTGGGSTDVRVSQPTYSLNTIYYSYIGDSNSNSSRIMVAAGGGGGAYGNIDGWSGYAVGGNGGGLSGDTVTGSYWGNQHPGNGGTQTSGGQVWYDGSHADSYVVGNFAVGGAQGWAPWGGGGSGWYGGSGGGGWTGPGAGGSSYISGHTGCVGISGTTNQTPKSGCSTGTTNKNCSLTPFTNPATNTYYTFINTSMIDGGGYSWTTAKGSKTNMPNTAGTGTEVGHNGNGYAKITHLGN